MILRKFHSSIGEGHMLIENQSEKARIPAWTDRILRKGTNLKQFLYDSAPLRFSDHRPVFAAFQCKVSIVNEALRESISQELYLRRKAEVGDATAHLGIGEDTDDEDLIGYDAIEPGLPPASSDRQKWWLDNKQPARAAVPVPKGRPGQAIGLNPNRPSNPFPHTEEPDWISIPRSSSKASLSSMSSSPFEKVSLPNAMSSSASNNTPRRLPPPYDPTGLPAKVGRMTVNDDHGSRGGIDTPPPPPPPRRQTGAMSPAAAAVMGTGLNRTQTQPLPPPLRPTSATSNTSSQLSQQLKNGKAPPPIAKKPAYLAAAVSPSRSSGTEGTGNGSFRDDDDDFRPPLPVRAATGFSQNSPQQLPGMGANLNRKPVAPPKPAIQGFATKSPAPSTGRIGLPGMTGGETRPMPPARRGLPPEAQRQQQQQQSHNSSNVDLLDSLDEGQVGGWETLKPSTKAQYAR